MGKFIDLTGQVFGRLTVVEQGVKNRHGNIMWRCVCECGNKTLTSTADLKSGSSRSCGCLRKQRTAEVKTKHGLSGTALYGAWKNAINRTTNPRNKYWKDYGGRGITVCDEWKKDYMNFHVDMSESWARGLWLDREDVNGNYCKENCRWVTPPMQGHNKRKETGCSSAYIGLYFNKERGKFQAQIKIGGKQVCLGRFTSELEGATVYDDYSEELYGDRPNKTNKGGFK